MENMERLSRRDFSAQTLGSLVTFSLLESLFASDAFGGAIKPLTTQWLAQLSQLSGDLKGRKLKQIEWQAQVESLMAQVDLGDVLRFIDFDKLTRGISFKEQGEQSLRIAFPQVEGLPTNLVFGHQLFALRKGNSVVPHGHDNMATAFLILQGDFHGRHYDRLEDDREFMVIRPTIDRKFSSAEYSTVSDFKDNVHWFKTLSETGFIFNIHVLSVKPGRSGRVYVDPDGEQLSGGRIRARKFKSAAEAYKRFG